MAKKKNRKSEREINPDGNLFNELSEE